MRRSLALTLAVIVAITATMAPLPADLRPAGLPGPTPARATTTATDDFSDNARDSGLWAEGEVYGTDVGYAEENGRLEASFAATAAQNGQTYFGAGYAGRCLLSGNFDMQVDFNLLTWPSAGDHYGTVTAMGGGATGITAFAGVSRVTSDAPTVQNLGGLGGTFGGSVSAGVSVGYDVGLGTYAPGQSYTMHQPRLGVGFDLGLAPPYGAGPAEIHGGGTLTMPFNVSAAIRALLGSWGGK